MTNDSMREAFEKWYYAMHGHLDKLVVFALDADSDYLQPWTQVAWEAWQAALESAQNVEFQSTPTATISWTKNQLSINLCANNIQIGETPLYAKREKWS